MQYVGRLSARKDKQHEISGIGVAGSGLATRRAYGGGVQLVGKLVRGISISDNGCHHHDNCFTCPFVECKLVDGNLWTPQLSINAARAEARRLHFEGRSQVQIARQLGVKPRRVSYWLHSKKGQPVELKAFCAECEKSTPIVRGTGSTYINAGAVEVKGKFECGHPASFITSSEQWAKWDHGVTA